MRTDFAIAKLQDQKERRRLDAAIWVWSRDAGHFSEEERIRLIDVLQATATADESDSVRSQSILALVSLQAPGARTSHWMRCATQTRLRGTRLPPDSDQPGIPASSIS